MSEPTANSSKGGMFSEERLYGMISRSSGTFPRSAGPRAYANWNVLLHLERARLLRRSQKYLKRKCVVHRWHTCMWMGNNKLKINADSNKYCDSDKTEFFVAASKHTLSQLQNVFLTKLFLNLTVMPSSTIRNLGVMFDSLMSRSSQVNSICRTTNLHIRNIVRIRKYIDQDTCHHVVCSLVTSRLDYCNSLL